MKYLNSLSNCSQINWLLNDGIVVWVMLDRKASNAVNISEAIETPHNNKKTHHFGR